MPLDINHDTLRITLTRETNHPVHFRVDETKYVKAGFILGGFNSPFGMEKYGKNYILNIEKPANVANIYHNQWVQITQIEKVFATINSTDKHYQFRQLVQDKQFVPSVKEKPGFDTLLRTKPSRSFRVLKNGQATTELLEKQTGTFRVVLGSVWINDTSYGLNWLVEEADIY